MKAFEDELAALGYRIIEMVETYEVPMPTTQPYNIAWLVTYEPI